MLLEISLSIGVFTATVCSLVAIILLARSKLVNDRELTIMNNKNMIIFISLCYGEFFVFLNNKYANKITTILKIYHRNDYFCCYDELLSIIHYNIKIKSEFNINRI